MVASCARRRPSDPLARIDGRVLTALSTVMAGRTATATITRRALFVQVRAALRDEHGPDVPIPNERDLYRLAARMDRGLHTFGAAATRRRTANRPDRPFRSGVTLRPGEHVQIDHQDHRHSVSIRGRCDPAGGVDDRGGRRDPQHPDRCGRTDDESGGCGRGAATPNRSALLQGTGVGPFGRFSVGISQSGGQPDHGGGLGGGGFGVQHRRHRRGRVIG
jgi:hypothetical protein